MPTHSLPRPKLRDIGVQTTSANLRDSHSQTQVMATLCSSVSASTSTTEDGIAYNIGALSPIHNHSDSELTEHDSTLHDDSKDADFKVSYEEEGSEEDESDSDNEVEETSIPDSKASFVVFWTSLLLLLKHCVTCGGNAMLTKVFYKGSMIGVSMLCEVGHEFVWRSQSVINGITEGNLRLAAGVLFRYACFVYTITIVILCANKPFAISIFMSLYFLLEKHCD